MDASAILNAAGNTKKYDIPIGNLDYGYIAKCQDVKMLEKIYRILKSGDEGCFPDLERFCEKRITELNPNSRALRKEIPISTKNDLQREDREMLDEDIKSWTNTMKTIEDHLKTPGVPGAGLEGDDDLPPIRSGNITITADGAKTTTAQTKPSNKRVMPREYRDWDKIDVDKELDKIDKDDDKSKEKTIVGNTVVKDIPTHIDTSGLSDSEKLMKANREKDKGNEAFRSNDFKEAITYYSRSISLQPTAASYNNRALAYLKNSDWQKALADCTKVLTIEPDNVKALLRRGTAYKGMKQYDSAMADLYQVVKLEPNNKRAKDLIEETEKTIEKEKEERRTKGRRMKIEDVDEIEEEEEEEPESQTKPTPVQVTSEEPAKSQSRKMKIEEVEDDDDDDDVEESVQVNGDIAEEEKRSVVGSKPVVNGLDATPAAAATVVEDKPNIEQASGDKQTKDSKSDETTVKKDEKKVESNVKASENTDGKSLEMKDDVKESEAKSVDTEQNEEIADSKDSDNSTDESESDKSEGSQKSAEKSEPVAVSVAQTLSRPRFYIKEYPASCLKLREEANSLFKSGQYGDAQLKYSKVINVLESMPDQVYNLSLTYSNRAACHLKTGELPGCVKDCNVSLDLVPHSVKPLLRRATAYEHLERHKKAYVDYRHVLLLDSRTEQAHLGTKRCQQILAGRDGPRWREKLQLPQVSPWDIPEIFGLDGQPIAPAVLPMPIPVTSAPGTSTSQAAPASCKQGASTSAAVGQSKPCDTAPVPKSEPVKKEVREPEKTPQEKFDMQKAKGNEHVKNGKFREAIQCYSDCAKILPDQTVSYTNRALCYIRVNEPSNAETDCNTALEAEKDNVKALFRRAQARKMLKRYRDGIEDLKHLLSVDPKNTAAKKEMDVLKNYWREELESMKKNLPSKSSDSRPGTSKGESKPCPRAAQSGAGKQRKKMVIEEVDSEEEAPTSGSKTQTSTQEQKPKISEVHSKPTSQKSSSKPVQEKSNPKPVQTKSDSKTKPVNKKSQIRETSSGFPQVPKSVPKLDKATPYEFTSAWNALKNTETVKPYYELLKQIKPADIKTVISNKLDGNMLNVITKCVAEHYIVNGEEDESYQILKNLSTVPRFGAMAMFMSAKEKSEMRGVMEKLSGHKSSVYSADDVQKLRKLYGV